MKLKKAVRRYLFARYWMLREREAPGSVDNLKKLLRAEEDLWEALTGKRDLFHAFVEAGGRLAKIDVDKAGRAKPRPISISTRPKKKRKKVKRAKLKR